MSPPTLTAPAAPPELAAPEPSPKPLTALERLMQRMQGDHDFPALSGAVTRIQRIAASDTESLASLAGEILKDVSMTHKLLRMVNTVHFSTFGGGAINTVSRAVAVVGFAGIRNMALSLLLLEQLQNKGHVVRLRQELLLSLMAAQLAQQLTPWAADEEEAYLAALFYNLGRLLTEFYLPADAEVISRLCGGAGLHDDSAKGTAPSSESAARQVLGLGFEALGLGIAKFWGLPDGLRHALARPTTAAPSKAADRGPERHRWLAALSNEVAVAMQDADPAQARRQVKLLAERYAAVLDTNAAVICSAADRACAKLGPLVKAIGLHIEPGTPGYRLLAYSAATAAPAKAEALAESTGVVAASDSAAGPRVADEARADMLAAGIQDVMATLSGDQVQLNVVLRMVMETALRALDLRRVAFCLRDPRSLELSGRFGLGADVDSWVRQVVIATKPVPGATPDLVSAVCHKALDTVIDDAHDPRVRHRLPAWFGEVPPALSFVLLPMVMKGETFALLYGDAVRPGGLALTERELALLRTLRNQAVMAFKQQG